MNSAYKHLEAKLRIGELTIGQWAGLFVGAMTALLWGMYGSPFGTTMTIFTSCYLGGLPATLIFLATLSDFDLWLLVRSAVRWRREEGRYLAGPGPAPHGYRVSPEPVDERRLQSGEQIADLDLAALWES
jgi:hypothetical protein